MNHICMDLEVFQRKKKKRHENPQLLQFLSVKGSLREMYFIHLEQANKKLLTLGNWSNCNPCQNQTSRSLSDLTSTGDCQRLRK